MKYSYDTPMPFTEISELYDELMDAPVRMTDGTVVSSLTLADRAYQHEYFGRQLRTQIPRFGFLFDSHDSVTSYLGNDAETVGHMYELGIHVAALIRELPDGAISPEERGILMLAVLGHDMDETTHDQIRHSCGGVTGDIPAGMKTDDDRALQVKIRKFRDTLLYADVPQSTLDRIELLISHQDETILGQLYEAAHELQSHHTTTVAEATLLEGHYNEADRTAIEHIATDIRAVVVGKLAPYAGMFACLGAIVESERSAA